MIFALGTVSMAFLGAASAILMVILIAPRYAAYLIWPVVFAYPQGALFGVLPLNAGVDDVLMILIATRLFIHYGGSRNLSAAKPALFVVTALVLMYWLGEITGAIRYPELWQSMVKAILKGLVRLYLVASIALDIQTDLDLRRHLRGICLGAAIGGATVVVSYFLPSLAPIWEVQDTGLEYLEGTAAKRAFGAFNGPAEIAAFACVIVPLGFGLMFAGRGAALLFPWGVTAVVGAASALLVAKTRSGILGLAPMFTLMVLFSNRRAWIVLLGVMLIPLAGWVLSEQVLTAVEDRFDEGNVLAALDDRIAIWMQTVRSMTFSTFFFGEGQKAFVIRAGQTPHNGYLDAVFVYGFGGFCCFCGWAYAQIKWARYVLRFDSEPISRAVAWSMLWSLVAIAFMSITSDPWFMSTFRLMSYTLLVIVGSRYRQLSAWHGEQQLILQMQAHQANSSTFARSG